MTPRAAKIATAILLAPVLLALVAVFVAPVDQFLRDYLGTHAGRLMITYTTIIFCFLCGTLWGFAVRSSDDTLRPYILSLLPCFYMLSAYSISGSYRPYVLMVGFLLLPFLDAYFTHNGLAPRWWLKFKIPFTAFMVISLLSYKFGNFILATLGVS
jgi:hypothetical protein